MNIWITGRNLMKHQCQLKKYFYSELNLESITDKDYARAKKVWDVFEIKNLDEYHDFYV